MRLLLLFLPAQLAKHFWPEWSYVLGLRIDYLSPTLYLTDILIFLILIFSFFKNPKIKINKIWFLFFGFLIINCLLAQNQLAAFYKLVKIAEFVLLGIFIVRSSVSRFTYHASLSLAIIYSSLIAIAQFLKQGSLGGIFYWLGERTFSVATPGIAKTVFDGRLLLRPYATFPHPNALAGFVLVSLILISSQHLGGVPAAGGATVRGVAFARIIRWPTLILGAAVIILSFSRSVWLASLLVIIFVIFRKTKRSLSCEVGECPPRSVRRSEISPGCWTLASFFSQEFIYQRLELNKFAGQMIKSQPLFGVGLNNFIVRLPDFWSRPDFVFWLQPVHNISLLVAAEIGLVGLIFFLSFLFLTYRRLLSQKNTTLLAALSVILFTGLFDHYWLTLQQNQLLFTFLLGLSWRETRSKDQSEYRGLRV